jgi:hypothetical protein
VRKLIILTAVSFLVLVGSVNANTIASSTMIFQGELTDNGNGTYSGTLAMVDEEATGLGDQIAGFDVYAENEAWATYDTIGSSGESYTEGIITNYDAYITSGGWGTS